MFRVIGVDPGASGAAAEVFVGCDGYSSGRVTDLPKVGLEFDVKALLDWAREGEVPLAGVVIEEIAFMPGDQFRAFGMMKLSRTFGELLGAFRGAGFRTELVKPQVWQKDVVGDLRKKASPKSKALKAAEKATAKVMTKKAKAEFEEAAKKAKAKAAADRRKETKAAVAAFVKSKYPSVNLTPGRVKIPKDGWADAYAIAHWGVSRCKNLVPVSAGPKPAEVVPAAVAEQGPFEMESTEFVSGETLVVPGTTTTTTTTPTDDPPQTFDCGGEPSCPVN